MSRPSTPIVVRVAAAAGALLLVAACSGSPAATSPSSSSPSSASPSAEASPTAEASAGTGASPAGESQGAGPSASTAAGSGATLALQAQDYSFSGPATVQAGVTTISLQNAGKEEHQAQLVRINDGKAFTDLTAALATGDPTKALSLVTVAGGPNLVQPGKTGETTQDLAPGNYAFVCFISGADGIPHVAKGMIAPLTVTGTASGGQLPAGDAQVTARDFTFDVPAPVSGGEHTFTFRNDGPQPHEAGIIKLTGDLSVDQIKAIFTASSGPSSPPPGPPPFEDVGGSGAIAAGSSATFTVDLEAGAKYAFICFVPDPTTGKAHAELGMITAIPTP